MEGGMGFSLRRDGQVRTKAARADRSDMQSNGYDWTDGVHAGSWVRTLEVGVGGGRGITINYC